jgi:hypothetical protein
MAILVGLGACAVLLVAVVGLKLLQRRAKPKVCRDCTHWDWESGQKSLNSSPTFRQVMQHLSPNQEFGEKVFAEREITDVEGTVTTQRYVKTVLPVYPPFEDRWEYLGGCAIESRLTHRINTCAKFKRRAA